ncbi:hypothetical protein NHX12_007603 [Muraenolepis orangiensis]|uniref:Uncharacterized protein n=1 Tax=Muraenolepis orangiensis TaxID=630683 RepID=A0A9Q0DQ77_9TELE|nr:hypothetical protein NHX12_007603 [Muraenolepis orangiensis]
MGYNISPSPGGRSSVNRKYIKPSLCLLQEGFESPICVKVVQWSPPSAPSASLDPVTDPQLNSHSASRSLPHGDANHSRHVSETDAAREHVSSSRGVE